MNLLLLLATATIPAATPKPVPVVAVVRARIVRATRVRLREIDASRLPGRPRGLIEFE
jgi:hypothetical protein